MQLRVESQTDRCLNTCRGMGTDCCCTEACPELAESSGTTQGMQFELAGKLCGLRDTPPRQVAYHSNAATQRHSLPLASGQQA